MTSCAETQPESSQDYPGTPCAYGSPIAHLVEQLRRALDDGAPVGVVVGLVSQVYIRGSWGPQTVSWANFLADERVQLVGLSQAERVPFVRGLHGQGLSQRSIAPFLGVSHQTVKNDCSRLGLSGRVIGANGKSYAPLPKWHLQGGREGRPGTLQSHARAGGPRQAGVRHSVVMLDQRSRGAA